MVVSDENAESVSVWQWNVAMVGELLVSFGLPERFLPVLDFSDYGVDANDQNLLQKGALL